MAQKKISMRQKAVEEVLHDAPLGDLIEVDQHIAAEDSVDALYECHLGIVRQIEPGESDVGAGPPD